MDTQKVLLVVGSHLLVVGCLLAFTIVLIGTMLGNGTFAAMGLALLIIALLVGGVVVHVK